MLIRIKSYVKYADDNGGLRNSHRERSTYDEYRNSDLEKNVSTLYKLRKLTSSFKESRGLTEQKIEHNRAAKTTKKR